MSGSLQCNAVLCSRALSESPAAPELNVSACMNERSLKVNKEHRRASRNGEPGTSVLLPGSLGEVCAGFTGVETEKERTDRTEE